MQVTKEMLEYEKWRKMLTPAEISDEQLHILVEAMEDDDRPRDILRRMYEEKVRKVCNQHVETTTRGDVEFVIDYKDGAQEISELRNTVLRDGKIALAKSLANEVADPYDFYVESMTFGSSGASGSTPKFVDESRTGLFGTTLLTKSVISSIDTASPQEAIFTSVVVYDELVGHALNEMGLKMKNGDLYSMITFPDLNKTSQMQLTINWHISML